MSTNKRILIVGPAWVGDMVMAQSLFKLIKSAAPDTHIEVLAPAWSLPLLERMPEVAAGIMMPIGHGVLGLSERYHIGKTLRAKRFDQAIVLPNSFKSALIPFFASIPKRTGWVGESRYIVLNDRRKLDKTRYSLMIEQFMALGLPEGALLPSTPFLPLLRYSQATQRAVLVRYGIEKTDKPILALCPGAEFGPAKRWPEQYYAEVAKAKLAQGWDVWLLGSPKDQSVADSIMRVTQQACVNLTGRTQLVEAVDLLSLATAVISNDSGLMHIAAAVHKPLIALYGPTSTQFTPPLHTAAKVLQLSLSCQPCFQRECPLGHYKCMVDLYPSIVLDALSELTCVS